MKMNLADSSFETLSAQKICINRGLLTRSKAVQNVPKGYKSSPHDKNKKDLDEGFTFGWNVLQAAQHHPTSFAGWSSPVARQAHNLKVVSSNLAPATNKPLKS